MSRTECSLTDRILDAFPAGRYGLVALLRILEIEESASIETAAVECKISPRLLINPSFVAAFAASPEKLMMLVMHELHHVLLGHTTLFPRVTPVQNLVFDAVINALLCRMFPDPACTSFFTDFYNDDDFPSCLLRPPSDWNPAHAVAVPPGLSKPELQHIGPIYRALYSETGADYYELFEALSRTVPPQDALGLTLIGDHRPDAYKPRREDPLFDTVREIVERWPQPPQPIAGRSWSDIFDSQFIKPQQILSNRALLRHLICKLASAGPAGRSRLKSTAECEFLMPLPAFDRRSAVLRALGHEPVLQRSKGLLTSRNGVEPVHVYVDVSGSIGDLKCCLYGAVLDCREFVRPRIHLFSTRVHTVTLEQLRRGYSKSTGGTSIDCIAAHMRGAGVHRAVLLTDGAVGKPQGEDCEHLRKARLGIALTPGETWREDLFEVADYWVQLKEERK
jgi:hypothetical protein